jgi:hypothetical protein
MTKSLKLAREMLRRARLDLGVDLAGFSVRALLLDQMPYITMEEATSLAAMLKEEDTHDEA